MKRIVDDPQREDRVEVLTENFPLSSSKITDRIEPKADSA